MQRFPLRHRNAAISKARRPRSWVLQLACSLLSIGGSATAGGQAVNANASFIDLVRANENRRRMLRES
jgi:hypothetical protein